MENAKISNLYDLNETIAKEYLEQFTYPWEAEVSCAIAELD